MKRVLIVDDAIDLARLLQDAIKTVHPDIPISVVPSAEEALLESTRFTIDVLVTDLRLPGMTGLDLMRKIRVRQPNVKVILMTGLRPEDRLYQADRRGIRRCVFAQADHDAGFSRSRRSAAGRSQSA